MISRSAQLASCWVGVAFRDPHDSRSVCSFARQLGALIVAWESIPCLVLAFVVASPISSWKADRFILLVLLRTHISGPVISFLSLRRGLWPRWAWCAVNRQPVCFVELEFRFLGRLFGSTTAPVCAQEVIQLQVVPVKGVKFLLASGTFRFRIHSERVTTIWTLHRFATVLRQSGWEQVRRNIRLDLRPPRGTS